MAQQARIQSPRAQRLAVTVVMALVFAVTLGLAYLTAAVSGAGRLTAGEFTSPQTVALDELRVTVPGEWDEDASTAAELGIDRGLLLRDPQRDGRWLLVTTTQQPRLVSPGDQMARYFEGLLGPGYDMLLQPVLPQRMVRRDDGAVVVAYVGVSPLFPGPGRRLHLMATITVDGLQHWLIYVTDRIEPGESMGSALERNFALFQRMEQSVEFEPPSPSEEGS